MPDSVIDLTPRPPVNRPLIWPDWILEFQSFLQPLPGEIYIVGGAVRDALLHRPLHDLDLATSGNAIYLTRQIANYFKGDFFALDAKRDVGRALVQTPEGRLVIDVAHLRGDSLGDDLKDRDFTVNAMAVNIKQSLDLLIDSLGGQGDLVAKHLRQCTPAAFENDPVRALRAVRQSAQFGMRIEAATLRGIRAVVPSLNESSSERLRDELMKLLALPRPAAPVRVAYQLGLLQAVLPEISSPQAIDTWSYTLAVLGSLAGILGIISYTRTDNAAASFSYGMMAIQFDRYRRQLYDHMNMLWPNERPHHALLMLAVLLSNAGNSAAPRSENSLQDDDKSAKVAGKRADALRLSSNEIQRLVTIIQHRHHPIFASEPNALAIHRFWRAVGEAGTDICIFDLADFLASQGYQLQHKAWLGRVERVRILLEAYYEKHDQLVAPPVLVDGNQLIQVLSLKPGPIIGQLLDHIREAQVEGHVKTTEDALDLARRWLHQHPADR